MTDQTAQAARVLYGHGIKTVSGWRPPTPENTTGRPQDGRGEAATTIDENENEEN